MTRTGGGRPGLMIIGLGRHTQDVYLPLLAREAPPPRIGCIVERRAVAAATAAVLAEQPLRPEELIYLSEDEAATLTAAQLARLDHAVDEHGITAVIVATPPERHLDYALWAAARGLHILVDKPLTTRERVLFDESQADGLLADYRRLVDTIAASPPERRSICLISTQRRYHPAWQRMCALIAEVTERTGCPVTALNAEYSDGEWRLPHDVLGQDYHPYMLGFGILSHSGYHLIDSVLHLLRAGASRARPVDAVRMSTMVVRPVDQLGQLDFAAYRRLFPAEEFAARNPYDQDAWRGLAAGAGEMDAYTTAQFLCAGDAQTTVTVQLMHNSQCHRGWLDRAGQNLYQGNGRLRQETYTIRQGPFQLVRFLSVQASKQTLPGVAETGPGGKNHVEIQVFRNGAFFGADQVFRRYGFEDLGLSTSGLGSHLENAKRNMMAEFLAVAEGRRAAVLSGLGDHDAGIRFLAAMYRSAARHVAGGAGHVAMPFELPPHPPVAERDGADLSAA